MSLAKIYKDLIQQGIILGYLQEGEIPTQQEIDEQFQQLIASNPSLSKPFTSGDQYKLSKNENSSAAKFNQTIDTLLLDLKALYSSIVDSGSQSTRLTEKTLSEFIALEKSIASLEESTSNLVLLAEDVEGFTDYIYDNFANSNKVDFEESSITVDNKTQTVQLPINKHSRIPVDKLSADSLQFNPLVKAHLVSNQPERDSSLLNALLDINKVWAQRVTFSQPPPQFLGELIIKFPFNPNISKMVARPFTSDKGTITSLAIQYSSDGLNWFDPAGDTLKRLVTDTTFLFDPVQANYWRLIFSKSGYDDFAGDSYVYEVGLKGLEFYGIEHEQNPQRLTEAELFSLPLRSEGSTQFNKASLKVCEIVPEGTSIDYQIAFMSDAEVESFQSGSLDLSDLHFSDIDPVGRSLKTKPVIVDGSRVSRLQNFSSSYGLDSTTSHNYKSNLNNVLVDDYSIGSTASEDHIQVWRNVGNNTLDGGGNIPVRVNNVSKGWVLDGDFYSCEFFISEPNGRVVDFGNNELEIDGLRTSNRVLLSYGKHRIKTHRRNWLVINPASVTGPSSSNPDLLYPFNHKYLIEGLDTQLYGVSLTADIGSGTTRADVIDPEEVYNPVSKYWGKTLKKVPTFDFAFKINDNDYTVFTVVEDVNGDQRVLVKYNTEPNLFTNENFAIIEDQITGDLFNYAVLRAFFKSTKKSSSPVLDSYTIRLGL